MVEASAESWISGTGNEPRSKHDPVQNDRSGAVQLRNRVKDADRKGTRADSEYRVKAETGLSQFIHIGFGNIVNTDKIIAVVSPDSAPVKASRTKGEGDRKRSGCHPGQRTKAVLVMENSQLILSALLPETIAARLSCRRIRSRLQRRKNRMNHRGLLVVVSGFSGVGKGTLVKKLVTECDNYALPYP